MDTEDLDCEGIGWASNESHIKCALGQSNTENPNCDHSFWGITQMRLACSSVTMHVPYVGQTISE